MIFFLGYGYLLQFIAQQLFLLTYQKGELKSITGMTCLRYYYPHLHCFIVIIVLFTYVVSHLNTLSSQVNHYTKVTPKTPTKGFQSYSFILMLLLPNIYSFLLSPIIGQLVGWQVESVDNLPCSTTSLIS